MPRRHHPRRLVVASLHAQARRWSSVVVLSTGAIPTVSYFVLTFHEREGAVNAPPTCGHGWAAERTFSSAYCCMSDRLRPLSFAFFACCPTAMTWL